MHRIYQSGNFDNAIFFIGNEVEKTPAFGLKTLFVDGIQPRDQVEEIFVDNNCEHIFFGANHSFNVGSKDYYELKKWEYFIEHFLKKSIQCTLDIPVHLVEDMSTSDLFKYHHFIPQIRIAIPNIKNWPYNTTIKIDDLDFQYSNPGVWCFYMNDTIKREYFTDWKHYSNDVIIEFEKQEKHNNE